MFKIFRWKKSEAPKIRALSLAETLLNEFEDSLNLSYGNRNLKLKDNAIWQNIQTHDAEVREEIAILAMTRLIDKADKKYQYRVVRRKLFRSVFNAKNPPSKAALHAVFDLCASLDEFYSYLLPPNEILFCFEHYKERFGKDEHYLKACEAMTSLYDKFRWETSIKKIVHALEKLNFAANETSVYDRRDRLGQHLDEHWEAYDDTFRAVIEHCWALGQKSKPSQKWLRKSQELMDEAPSKAVLAGHLRELIELLIAFAKAEVKRIQEGGNSRHIYLHETNEIAVSYLVWFAGVLDDQLVNGLIGQLAAASYKKIRWVGSLSTKNGNACMYSFTLMPPKVGITQLLNIRNKNRNKSIRNTADRLLARKAQELGISEEALLELSVPTFNLNHNQSKWEIGSFTGVIDISEMNNPITYWINNKTEKRQKTVPKEVKDKHAEALKTFKATLKEIKTAISVHARRLENSYLDNIVWTVEDWQENYLHHPFLSRYAQKLIWWFDEQQTAIVTESGLLDAQGEALDLKQFKSVRLWHPIYSELAAVTAWRDHILNKEIQQPFKQAYREIYVLTDAEINTHVYSNRFAAHILYQHQFTALAKTRDWQYTLQGAFDSHNTPTRSIPKFKLAAQFWVEPITDETGGSGIYTYVASDQVRFYNGREVLEMADVPRIVFSEIMRDVDLFVGVTSIGNNPEWEDAGDRRTYWHTYSFGNLSETAKTRKEVLERILPKLKIADRCRIEDKFLIVEGTIRRYKIHLGSGNILMSPNDQYLCIVPSSRSAKSKIFLPFDNDRTLSIILSKAFLLYADDKITDTTITRQIKL